MSHILQAARADERARFLVVGAINTGVGYAVFALIYYLLGSTIGLLGSLAVAHLVSSTLAFVLYRKLVFVVRGSVARDYARFQGVYLVSLMANGIILWLTAGVLKWNPYLAQAVAMTVVTTSSYFGHRLFSFRRSKPAP